MKCRPGNAVIAAAPHESERLAAVGEPPEITHIA
jgi:hypothetical protein